MLSRSLVLSAALGLALNGCATLPTTEAQFLSQLQAAVKDACAYVPDAADVIAVFVPDLAMVAQDAAQICAQVEAAPTAMAYSHISGFKVHAPVTVGGHLIRFVK